MGTTAGMSSSASAKMALAFAELTGGVKFDGKRHRRDMALFGGGGGRGGEGAADRGRGSAGASASGRGAGEETGGGGAENARGGGGASAKRRAKAAAAKRARRDDPLARDASDDDEDDGAIDVFGGGKSSSAAKNKKKSAAALDADGTDRALADAASALAPAARSRQEEAANVLRKKHKIRVQGAGVSCPAPLDSFADLAARYDGAGKALMRRLAEAGFDEPTPIQRQAIPILLEANELLAIAPTGSGKTLSFLLPIVVKLRTRDDDAGGPRALLLSPTKELAQQSHRILKLLCRGTNSLRCVSARDASFVFATDSIRSHRASRNAKPNRGGDEEDHRAAAGLSPRVQSSGTWDRWRSNPPFRAVTQPMDARTRPV